MRLQGILEMVAYVRPGPTSSGGRICVWDAPVRRKLSDLRCLALVCFIAVLSSLIFLNYCATQIFSLSHFDVGVSDMDDNRRIRASISEELIELEKRRNSLAIDVSSYTDNLRNLRGQIQRLEARHRSLLSNIDQSVIRLSELTEINTPMLAAPRSLDTSSVNWSVLSSPTLSERQYCSLDSCWDYGHCSLTSSLNVYIYPLSDMCGARQYLRSQILHEASMLVGNQNVLSACAKLFVVCADSPETARLQLQALPHWFGDGRSHILLAVDSVSSSSLQSIGTGRSLLLSSNIHWNHFRWNFDLVLPHIAVERLENTYLPPMVPIRRFLLVVWPVRSTPRKLSQSLTAQILADLSVAFVGQNISRVGPPGNCRCDERAERGSDWCLCDSAIHRADSFSAADFALIPFDGSTSASQQLLWEALRAGCVPVVIGRALLPLQEVVDWRLAIVRLSASRVTELHYYLRAIADADVLAMRRHGRQIWQQYLVSPEAVVKSTIAQLSERLGMLPATTPIQAQVINSTKVENLKRSIDPVAAMDSGVITDEYLGPIETSVPSPIYQHNMTASKLYSYERWNRQFWPHVLLPNAPFHHTVSSDAKFNGSVIGFRHINKGAGGSGREFSMSLGGNVAHEQFTVIILTYDRHQVLMKAIARLRGVPYLNKVLVVWNGKWPIEDVLPWPEIDAPVEIVSTGRNSLNNRFIPFDQIETEAILSLDDDLVLRHDEIVFGFRVWREKRDLIVGFPGRFHAWDPDYGGWHYNSNHSCELSIVLTGAAFFHKYYSYMYTYWMSENIRDKVDELMNCEDIAMNFLVSHITQKPPIKTTTRWTFRCPDCAASISERSNHFSDRGYCINYFSRIYGYTPLLYTQFRADSVLYKTRLPSEHQKCFRIV